MTTDKTVKLSEAQRKALILIAGGHAILWPSRYADEPRLYTRGGDGRMHYIAPVDDATALFDAGFINNEGRTTTAGRAILNGEKTND